MNIVISVCGKGQRFKDAGYIVDKQFLKSNGETLLQKAFKGFQSENKVLIKRQNDKHDYSFLKIQKIISIPRESTKGPLDSISYSLSALKMEEPVVFVDCDIEVLDVHIIKKISQTLKNHDAALISFKANSDKYSYIKIDDDKIVDIKEKELISDNAVLGVYCFKNGYVFKKYIIKTIKMLISSNKEWFTSKLFEVMIRDNVNIGIIYIDSNDIKIWGTPEEYEINRIIEEGKDDKK